MNLFPKKRIFLDYASTTPVLPEVVKVMQKYFSESFFNPSAIYTEAVSIHKDLDEFRTQIARLLGVQSRDIVFTASGTESCNLALLGIFEKYKTDSFTPHFIISSIEHPAISESAKEIKRRGGEVTVISVNEKGHINPQDVLKAIKENTVLVSIMYGNNETGAIEPIHRIARDVSEYRKKHSTKIPFIHTDASQAAAYLPIEITRLGVDIMTLDAFKLYGPKGIGLLVVRPNVEISPIIFGGGQERGLRSGTENLALIAGFTKALEIISKDKEKESKRISEIKEFFIKELENNFPEAIINTHADSLPHIVSVSFKDQMSEFLAIKLDIEGIMVSTGSACGSGKEGGGSVTINAIGKAELAESTLRFSFGRYTRKEDIKIAIKALQKILKTQK